jgi:hypothetical protein
VTEDEMKKNRRQRNREGEAKRRRERRTGKAIPLSREKPWIAAGVSRRTWYRRRGTKTVDSFKKDSSKLTTQKVPRQRRSKPAWQPPPHVRPLTPALLAEITASPEPQIVIGGLAVPPPPDLRVVA